MKTIEVPAPYKPYVHSLQLLPIEGREAVVFFHEKLNPICQDTRTGEWCWYKRTSKNDMGLKRMSNSLSEDILLRIDAMLRLFDDQMQACSSDEIFLLNSLLSKKNDFLELKVYALKRRLELIELYPLEEKHNENN